MVDETQAWQACGVLVTSGSFGASGPAIHARCADAETAEHIVRLHNGAIGDGARTPRVVRGTGPELVVRRPTFGDPPVNLVFSSEEDPYSIPRSIRIVDE